MGRRITYDTGPPKIEYTDFADGNSALTSYSFSVGIGTASPTRLVIVPVAYFAASTSFSMTINGVAATEYTGCALDFGTAHTRMFGLNVPTGTTATVDVTMGAAGACRIAVFAADNLISHTPFDTSFDDTGTIVLDLDVDALGVACGYAFIGTGSPAPWSWSGMIETFDNGEATAATYTASSAQTPLSVVATPTALGTEIGCAASFR